MEGSEVDLLGLKGYPRLQGRFWGLLRVPEDMSSQSRKGVIALLLIPCGVNDT